MSFVAAFGTICPEVAYGTCKNEKTEISAPCGRRRPVGKSAGRALRVPSDAEAAVREGGDEAADEEGGLGATTVFT